MNSSLKKRNEIFENLFVLELANNHWGSLERGLKIIHDHGTVIRYNNVKAAIKLQFRDVNEFVHKDFKGNQDIRYIKKTEDTRLSKADFARMVEEIRRLSIIPMATPFDEYSVDLCVEFGMPIIKIASSDVADWPLIEKIASKKLPVIVSTGGASEKNLDDIVAFFEHRDIPLALNHCVSLYPSEDDDLEMNQIDYLRQRYPDHVIGFSTHEYRSWDASMYISYAKGARTWERHIDIDYQGFRYPPTAPCRNRSTPGSRPTTRPGPCAAAAIPAGASVPPRKSPIWMPWSEGSMPNANCRRDTSSPMKHSNGTSISPFPCKRGSYPAGR